MSDALPAPLSSERLRYIDALRAIAALLVVWLHAAATFPMASPETAATGGVFVAIPGFIDVGHIGVVVFFLISGFVIPFSILPDRAAPVGSFVIKRILRIYPSYSHAVRRAVSSTLESISGSRRRRRRAARGDGRLLHRAVADRGPDRERRQEQRAADVLDRISRFPARHARRAHRDAPHRLARAHQLF